MRCSYNKNTMMFVRSFFQLSPPPPTQKKNPLFNNLTYIPSFHIGQSSFLLLFSIPPACNQRLYRTVRTRPSNNPRPPPPPPPHRSHHASIQPNARLHALLMGTPAPRPRRPLPGSRVRGVGGVGDLRRGRARVQRRCRHPRSGAVGALRRRCV